MRYRCLRCGHFVNINVAQARQHLMGDVFCGQCLLDMMHGDTLAVDRINDAFAKVGMKDRLIIENGKVIYQREPKANNINEG